MMLTFAAGDCGGNLHNWILGGADVQFRFSRKMYCSLPTNRGDMCAHLGLIVLMAMVMMATVMMGMVLMAMMAIIVPQALRQVDWLLQR
jgi:hypothetical protein